MRLKRSTDIGMLKCDIFGNVYVNNLSTWMTKIHPVPPNFKTIADVVHDRNVEKIILDTILETIKTGIAQKIKCKIQFSGYKADRQIRFAPAEKDRCLLFFEKIGDFLYYETPLHRAIKD